MIGKSTFVLQSNLLSFSTYNYVPHDYGELTRSGMIRRKLLVPKLVWLRDMWSIKSGFHCGHPPPPPILSSVHAKWIGTYMQERGDRLGLRGHTFPKSYEKLMFEELKKFKDT